MRRVCVILFLLLCATWQCLWAKPFFRHLGVRDGLPNPNVLAICQDSLGRIWLGTESGASYFDGDVHPVRTEGEVSRMLCDASGAVWFISEGRLFRYACPGPDLQLVLKDRADAICLVDGVLHVVSGKEDRYWNDEVKSLSLYRFLPFDGVRGMCVDKGGNTWITCPLGLISTPPSARGNNYAVISPISDLGALFEASDGTLWAGSVHSGAVCVRSDGTVRRYTVQTHGAAGFPSDNVRAFAESASGELWLGTFRGLCRYRGDTGRFTVYQREESEGCLGSSSIHSLLTDRDAKLWAGTYHGGVYYSDTRPGAMAFYSESPDGGLSHSVVGHLAAAPDGGVWICTEGGGLNLLQGERIISFGRQPFTNVKWVEPSAENGYMWLATQPTGLYRMDLERRQFHKVIPVSASSPLSIVNLVLHYGDELYLSTEDGVYVHSLKNGTDSLLFPCAREARYVHEMIAGNELWLASSKVVVFDLETKRIKAEYPILDGETDVRPMRLLAASNGSIYATTFGHGLYVLRNGSFRPLIEREAQLNSSGYQLVEAPGGQLIVSGDKGIQLIDGSGRHVRSWLTGQDLPLESLVRDSGLLLSDDGTVYAGGTNGLVSFSLYNGLENGTRDIYFSELYVDGALMALPSSGRLVLKGKQNQIDLWISSHHHVTDLNWANYQYRVKGFNNAWRDLNGRHIKAELIPPGNYCFELRDRSRDEVICSFPVVIRAQWYNSSVAIVVYAILMSFIVLMLVRNLRLRRLARRIHELNETKLRFFTTVSHELRSPLTLIIAQIDSIFRMFHLPPQVTHKMNKVKSQAEQMNQLVTELIDFRKFEQDLVTLHMSPTYVNAFAADIFEKFTEIASGKDIAMEMMPDASNPLVFMDSFHMQKVLMNLVFNAVKYTPSGGKIQVAVESDPDQVYIHVRDTGIGIAPDEQERVFERFYQSEHPDNVTQGIPGSGIGLALAKDIARKHHGDISLSSEPGRGSDFTLSLPKGKAAFLEDDSVVIEPEQLSVEQDDDGRLTAVIAEDNSQMREILRELFEVQYHIYCASDGAEALDLIKQVRPDLVVSDVMMPRMSGTDLCAAVKNTEGLRDIPVVLLTAIDQTEQQIGGLLKGADDYITKPFNSRVLLARCNNLVRSRRQNSAGSAVSAEDLSLKATSQEDKDFLEKLSDIIEKNIDNPELNNSMLVSLMNMSRSSFYGRFRSVTSETPNGYITSFRLKKAAQMLRQEPGKTIAEVAEALGFSTQNYFCRCFKSHYGLSPTQYRKM